MNNIILAQNIAQPNCWTPFKIGPKADPIRSMQIKAGILDRLRTVAFAEILARDCFQWAAENILEAPLAHREIWESFANVENRHAQMLLDRFFTLSGDLGERYVSDKLYRLCTSTTDPTLFLFMISSAEERGMEAGHILGKQMQEYDSTSAAIFEQIAQEEHEHVEFANSLLAKLDLVKLKSQAVEANRQIEC